MLRVPSSQPLPRFRSHFLVEVYPEPLKADQAFRFAQRTAERVYDAALKPSQQLRTHDLDLVILDRELGGLRTWAQLDILCNDKLDSTVRKTLSQVPVVSHFWRIPVRYYRAVDLGRSLQRGADILEVQRKVWDSLKGLRQEGLLQQAGYWKIGRLDQTTRKRIAFDLAI